MLTRSESEALLHSLGERMAFFLTPHARKRLIDDPPGDVESYTDAVLLAEGFDPPTVAGRQLRRQVRTFVQTAFDESAKHR